MKTDYFLKRKGLMIRMLYCKGAKESDFVADEAN